MTQEKRLTEFQQFLKDNFPKLKFRSDTLKLAGKLFKKSPDKQEVIKFLTGKEDDSNFKPPSKCNVIASNRPFKDWDISIASSNIQKFIYSLSLPDFQTLSSSIKSDRKSIDNFLASNSINFSNYNNVQGLNLIINNSINTYNGVLEKIKNRNEKNQEKADDKGMKFEPVEATNKEGRLTQPPGINANIFCYQQSKVRALDPEKDKNILLQLPSEYHNYSLNSNSLIPNYNINRLAIPKGQRGYIPEFQRTKVKNEKRRVRKWYANNQLKSKLKQNSKINELEIKQAKAKDAILFVLNIGKDWCVIDARGLLRNVKWRKLADNNNLTLQNLRDFFTRNPVIDPKRNIITFSYAAGKIKVRSEYLVHGKKSKQVLEDLSSKEPIALVAIDLGGTNPQSTQYLKISNANTKQDSIKKEFLPQKFLNDFEQLKKRHDLLAQNLEIEAINLLTQDQQQEVKQVNSFSTDQIKDSICQKYNVNKQNLPWDKMTEYTHFISDAFIQNGGNSDEVHFETNPKKGKSKRIKKNDFKHAMEFKPKLSKETEEIKNKTKCELQRNSLEYKKLWLHNQQLCRTIVNNTIARAQEITGCKKVVIAIENLTMDNRMFSGSGKRDIGFDNFFTPKKENRFIMKGLHKAYSEKAKHCGMTIIEVVPHFTSMTCPNCLYCKKENRKGENFKCKNCPYEGNADLDIATTNIAKVAITGLSMPKPPDERFNDTKNPVSARKAKLSKSNTKKEMTETSAIQPLQNLEPLETDTLTI